MICLCSGALSVSCNHRYRQSGAFYLFCIGCGGSADPIVSDPDFRRAVLHLASGSHHRCHRPQTPDCSLHALSSNRRRGLGSSLGSEHHPADGACQIELSGPTLR